MQHVSINTIHLASLVLNYDMRALEALEILGLSREKQLAQLRDKKCEIRTIRRNLNIAGEAAGSKLHSDDRLLQIVKDENAQLAGEIKHLNDAIHSIYFDDLRNAGLKNNNPFGDIRGIARSKRIVSHLEKLADTMEPHINESEFWDLVGDDHPNN